MTTPDPLSAFRLDDRVAIVTGASSGLGARFARTLAGVGAKVVLAARRADRLEALAAELPDALAVAVDLTEAGAAADLVNRTVEHYGRIDVLVNNAGVSTAIPALDFDEDDFRREVEIDLVAPYALARATGAWAIENAHPLSIVNIGSVLGFVGGGKLRVPGYAAAKGGLHNLTRELASQWARKGVRVNAIAPGWFETEMNTEMFEDDRSFAYMADGAPMGRAGIDGELDGALLLLASDASSFMTGAIVAVDGGWTAV
ncbi:MAG: SDR family oxidoreductase [Acidimicrobiales bacterium]|nr:SDR family oxidoreductase [Acidimicrobiales bacterium]